MEAWRVGARSRIDQRESITQSGKRAVKELAALQGGSST